MKPTIFFFVILFSLCSGHTQEKLTNEEAFKQYNDLMEEIKVKKPVFGSAEYMRYYLQKHDLLDNITDRPELLITTYHHDGYGMSLLGLNKQVIINQKKFFQYLEQSKTKVSDSFYNVYRTKATFNLGVLADAYSNLGHLDSAEAAHLKNLKWAENPDNILYPSAINNYGLFLFNDKKDNIAALQQFDKAMEIAKMIDNKNHFIGSVRDNIADVYLAQGRKEAAKKRYKENIDFYAKTTYTDRQPFDIERYLAAIQQYVSLALEDEELSNVEAICQTMNREVANRQSLINAYPKAKLQYLEINENVAKALNKLDLAYAFSVQRQRLQDSITTAELNSKSNRLSAINEFTLDKLKTNYELEKSVKEAKIQAQRSKLWIISLLLSLGILIFGGLYLRRRYKLIQARQNELLAQRDLELATIKNEQLNTEIKSKERDLSDFAVNLSQSQKWAQELAEKLDNLKGTRGRERQKLFQEFEQSIQSKITFDDETKEFYQKLDKLSHGFYATLKERFKNLTKTELQLISLIRLTIDSHQIATLQNITLASLNTSRYRLRKKLGLEKGEDLDQFIQNL